MNSKVQKDIEQFEALRQRLAHSKQASHDFLVKAGIITAKGNLKAQYKHLCIPQEPA
ncbi:hypothetical protein [Hymenobacter fastidiosus]|uniref:hypothetical protein n=1 Tax=Hymenobacter fastidiosus TaxID=486264 RepID=UPI0031F18987